MAHLMLDYDDRQVFEHVIVQAARVDATNFIVEFGSSEAKVGINLSENDLLTVLQREASKTTQHLPARWINLWAPHRLPSVVKSLSETYQLSTRLSAILVQQPPDPLRSSGSSDQQSAPRSIQKPSDINEEEQNISISSSLGAYPGVETTSVLQRKGSPLANFSDIAHRFRSYQTVDIGPKFLCVGSNWTHVFPDDPTRHPKPLWAWLILCNDGTVITLHEEPWEGLLTESTVGGLRSNVLNVLRQLSRHGANDIEAVNLVSLRNSQPNETESANELSSNLFYYLFDDWLSTMMVLHGFQQRMKKLRKIIMAGLHSSPENMPVEDIIPGLYEIGRHLRTNQHLYKGYENLIGRILQQTAPSAFVDDRSRLPGVHETPQSVVVAVSACYRFERLKDNIKFMVLNYLEEAISEKEGLQSMYFNITTQKDSRATAILSANAALLSKLGVLFLPVSLMTSYFSIQIAELEGVYTVKTYWVAFAVVVVASFMLLFMFSRVLQGIGTGLTMHINNVLRFCKNILLRTNQGSRPAYTEAKR